MGSGLLMSRIVAGLLAVLLVDSLALLPASSAQTGDAIKPETLRCSFTGKQGYYKFSRFRPAGKRPWDFVLKLDSRGRQAIITANGVTSPSPFLRVGSDIRFDVTVDNTKERVFLDAESLKFKMISETQRHRLSHFGVCQPQPD